MTKKEVFDSEDLLVTSQPPRYSIIFLYSMV